MKLDVRLVDFSRVDVSGLDSFEAQFVKINGDYAAQERVTRAAMQEIEDLGKEIAEKQKILLTKGIAAMTEVAKMTRHANITNAFANTLADDQLERVKQRLLAAQTTDAPTTDAPTTDAPTQ